MMHCDDSLADAPDGRELEVAALVGGHAAGMLLDPAQLESWLCSRSQLASGGEWELTVEEEYGYRRVMRCVVRVHGHRMRARVVEAARYWDGKPGAREGEPGGPAQWAEPALLGTELEVSLHEGALRARWRGFAPGAADAARREGELLLYSLERARALVKAPDEQSCELDREVAVPPSVVWQVLDAADHGAAWLGGGGLLLAEPGARWSAGSGRDAASGRVVLAVSGRRLVASWHHASAPSRTAMLELRAQRRHDAVGTRIHARIHGARVPAAAQAWLRDTVDRLARAAEVTRTGA